MIFGFNPLNQVYVFNARAVGIVFKRSFCKVLIP